MPLEVKVISYRGHPPVENLKASFGQDGGTLGRSPDKRNNHLTLPDPEQYISRSHASITFENGLYYLKDTSVDGTFVNDRNRRVSRETVTLADGDRIWIGDYELRVHIFSNGTQESADDIFQLTENKASFSDMDRGDRKPTNSSADPNGQANDHDWWSGGNIFEESDEKGRLTGQPEPSPMHDTFVPPDIVDDRNQPKTIPTDFNFEQLFDDMDAPRESHPPTESVKSPGMTTGPDAPGVGFDGSLFDDSGNSSADSAQRQTDPLSSAGESFPHAPPSGSATSEEFRQQVQRDLIRIFMDAAGIDESDFPEHVDMPQLMASMGAVFRELVKGMMAVLRGRSELKTHLRVEATSIKPAGNNPLKFFREVDEALKQLLIGDQPGFTDAQFAVREGFKDIMNHQMAMNAGLQAALIHLIGRFDPQGFTSHHENGVVFQKKAKYWDAYQKAYEKIANEALENIFGKPFADAYEEQIRKLASKPKQR